VRSGDGEQRDFNSNFHLRLPLLKPQNHWLFFKEKEMRNKSVSILITVFLYLSVSNIASAIIFNDGGIHNIGYITNESVGVENSDSGKATTVNIISGGKINNVLSAWGDSVININGGEITGRLYARDNTQVVLKSGVIDDYLEASQNSRINISGGKILNEIAASNNSTIIVSGGSILGLTSLNESNVFVSGGEIGSYKYSRSLLAYDNSRVNITNGIIYYLLSSFEGAKVNIYGGSYPHGLWVEDSGLITIFGKDFVLHDNGRSYTPGYGMIPAGMIYDRLTGVLANGSSIDTNLAWDPFNPGNIVLAIPEPSTLLLLGLGAVILRRKRCG
jgi:hypothetical protein